MVDPLMVDPLLYNDFVSADRLLVAVVQPEYDLVCNDNGVI